MRDPERGYKEMEAALELDPNSSEANIELSGRKFRNGNIKKGLRLLKKAAFLKNPNAFDQLGEKYFKWGKLDKAVSYREKALEIKPDLYPTYWALAVG
jgi:tetratricopeptide (TPR) repeat protein